MEDELNDVFYELKGVVMTLDMLIEKSEDDTEYLYQLLRNSVDRACNVLKKIQ